MCSTCNDFFPASFPTFTLTNTARLDELVIHHLHQSNQRPCTDHCTLAGRRKTRRAPGVRTEKHWSRQARRQRRQTKHLPNSTILRQTSPLSANHTGAPTQHFTQPPLLPIDGDNSAHVLTSSCPRSCWEELEGGRFARDGQTAKKNQSEP